MYIVFKDHSAENPNMAFEGRWSLLTSELVLTSVSGTNKMQSLSTGGLCLKVVFVYWWSLAQV
jgi:hypothetical protein